MLKHDICVYSLNTEEVNYHDVEKQFRFNYHTNLGSTASFSSTRENLILSSLPGS